VGQYTRITRLTTVNEAQREKKNKACRTLLKQPGIFRRKARPAYDLSTYVAQLLLIYPFNQYISALAYDLFETSNRKEQILERISSELFNHGPVADVGSLAPPLEVLANQPVAEPLGPWARVGPGLPTGKNQQRVLITRCNLHSALNVAHKRAGEVLVELVPGNQTQEFARST
jgi:hypothetical protein